MRDEYIQRADDEIDLIEMLVTLWRGKWLILLITLVFAGLGIAYAKLSPKTWTSQAEILPAKYEQIAKLSSIINQLESIVGRIEAFHRKDKNDNELSHEELFFVDVMNGFRGRDYKLAFIEQTELYAQKLQEEGVSKDSPQGRGILDHLVNESINVQLADEKKDTLNEISFTADSPEAAYDLLNDYLNFVSQQLFNDLKEDVYALLESRGELLELGIAYSEMNARINKNILLDRLKAAYQVADLTGVRKLTSLDDNGNTDVLASLAISNITLSKQHSIPSTLNSSGENLSGSYRDGMQTESESLLMFMLGTENLASQIKVLEDNPVIYSSQYYQDKNDLEQLNKLVASLEQTGTIKMYSIVSSPTYPIKSDGQGTTVIVLIALVFGLLFATMLVLISKAFNNRIN